MDLQQLSIEIQSDIKLSTLITTGKDIRIAESLNSKNIVGDHWISGVDLVNALQTSGAFIRLMKEAANIGPTADFCKMLLWDLEHDKPLEFRKENTEISNGFVVLVQAQVITQAQADFVLAAFTPRYISRAEQLWGLGVVTSPKEVGIALRGEPLQLINDQPPPPPPILLDPLIVPL